MACCSFTRCFVFFPDAKDFLSKFASTLVSPVCVSLLFIYTMFLTCFYLAFAVVYYVFRFRV